ncbi:MAG: hypothetical protein IPH07_28020 [Deltaproteobacteria bacterium]|nr:hypothetical protein [Deltaproteobacteria bacterium]
MVQPPFDPTVQPHVPHGGDPQPFQPQPFQPQPFQPQPFQPQPFQPQPAYRSSAAPPRPKSSHSAPLAVLFVVAGALGLGTLSMVARLVWFALSTDTTELATRSDALLRDCASAGDAMQCAMTSGSPGDGNFTRELRARISHWEAKHGELANVDTARGCDETEGFGHMAVVVVVATFGDHEQPIAIRWVRLPDSTKWMAMSLEPIASISAVCK